MTAESSPVIPNNTFFTVPTGPTPSYMTWYCNICARWIPVNEYHNHNAFGTVPYPTYTYTYSLPICPICGMLSSTHARKNDDDVWVSTCPVFESLIKRLESIDERIGQLEKEENQNA